MPHETKKRVTIYDVAKALNVSTATVHRALSGKETIHEKTRERVLEMVDRLGYRPNRLARSLSSKNVRLAVVAFTSFPEFHDSIIAGAKQATEDLADFNLHTDFYSYSGGDSNAAAGTEFLNNTLERIAKDRYDGLLICARNADGFAAIERKKIPVVTVVNHVAVSTRKLSIRYHGRVAGRMAAELLYRMGNANQAVAIASGSYGERSIHSEILEGFKEQALVTPLSLVATYSHYDSKDAAYDATIQTLREHPYLAGIYVDSFNSFGVIEAVKDMGMERKLTLITSDISENLRAHISQGIVQATICQNQFEQGRMGLEHLFWYIMEGTIESSTILLPPQLVLNSNIELY